MQSISLKVPYFVDLRVNTIANISINSFALIANINFITSPLSIGFTNFQFEP